MNWVYPGWLKTLGEAGYRVIALDNRGHGASDKHFFRGLSSLGHGTGCYCAARSPGNRLSSFHGLFNGGSHFNLRSSQSSVARPLTRARRVGHRLTDGVGDWDPIADALLAQDPDAIDHERGRMFRTFADQTRVIVMRWPACIRGSRDLVDRSSMATIKVPTLIGVGTKDDIADLHTSLLNLCPMRAHSIFPIATTCLPLVIAFSRRAFLSFYAAIA